MNTISNLLTVTEAATDQIETAYDSGHRQIQCLEDKVVIALGLLDNIESMLAEDISADTQDNNEVIDWASSADVIRLFGT